MLLFKILKVSNRTIDTCASCHCACLHAQVSIERPVRPLFSTVLSTVHCSSYFLHVPLLRALRVAPPVVVQQRQAIEWSIAKRRLHIAYSCINWVLTITTVSITPYRSKNGCSYLKQVFPAQCIRITLKYRAH